ncbi:MAG TPA: hypothetical protein VFP50_18215 [Anaeromyxobacteraceae bacterium]|nr:hypothetical protein [Anaeromyxobacteraceae bacterium]
MLTPMDMGTPGTAPGGDAEESQEQDALSKAFDQIRATIDKVERSLVTGKRNAPGCECGPPAAEEEE